MAKSDYYIILGVSRSESSAGIHEAFRKLAKKYHPDLGGPEATETFQEISQAYEILSDPEQRRTYDQTLRQRDSLLRAEPLEQARHQGGYQPEPLVPRPMSILHDFQTIRPSFDALFDRILRNFNRIGTTKGERIEDLNIEVILTPMEAARGVVAPIDLPVFRTCWSCHGTGREWLFSCMTCAGHGMIEENETISMRIPPMVHDRSVIEWPIQGLGIHNFPCASIFGSLGKQLTDHGFSALGSVESFRNCLIPLKHEIPFNDAIRRNTIGVWDML